MQITFLGTSSGVPTRSRNVSSVALRLPQRSDIWLFDCGEGTQHQFLRSDLRPSQITKIFITHMHGDHIFGLMGLLASCGLAGDPRPIQMFGPPELKDYLKACQRYSKTRFAFPIEIFTVELGKVFEDKEFKVFCLPLKHRVQAFGYRVEEKDRPGRFDINRAKEMEIPPGPVYADLKQGKTVTLEDGRVINGKEFCSEPEIGRKFVYCTDTVFCDNAIELSHDADVLIHEATFAHQDAEMAFERLHSTSTMAAQVALGAGAKHLILTHFSPRYNPGNAVTFKDLLKEAKAIFPNTSMAKDFLVYDIPRRRSPKAKAIEKSTKKPAKKAVKN
ncbi:MAG: ribonuclease Z [Cyanophyceae cyanobacterium]